MKRFSYFLSALALVVSMQGCGNGPSVEPELPDSPNNPNQSAVQLRLKGNISAIAPSTRVNADGFEADDKVGVYVSATGSLTESGNMLDNEAFTYAGGNITAPEGKEVYWGTPETKLSVWAYYPYVESISNNAAYPFAVAADQSDEADYYNSDFITAQAANLAPQAEAVNLTFNHSMSKIAVTLKKGTGVTDEEWAAATKSLSVRGVVVDGTIDLATGVATAGTTKGEVKSFANGGTYSSIVYPQEGEITFRLEMDGDIYTYTTDADYEAGYEYDYEFTINVRNPQQMALNTTTITTWGDGGETEMGTMSDIISIPDPVFKAYLLGANLYEFQENATEDTIADDYVDTGRKIDANSDGEISIAEAEAVVFLNMNELGVSDLSGIEYFVNLEVLGCSQVAPSHIYDPETYEPIRIYTSKYLTSIDLSENRRLKYLECTYNYNLNDGKGLTTLELSENVDLKYLYCENNMINELDLSNNINLEYLSCGANKLTTIDLSKNTKLQSLNLFANQLTSLNVSHLQDLTHLACGGNPMSALDVTRNLKLRWLTCYTMNLTTLDLTKNTELEIVQCHGNKLTSLDVTKNTKLENLWCGEQDITSIDVSKNTVLTELNCYDAKITSLDLSNNLELVMLICGKNELTELDLSNNIELDWLDCDMNKLTELDLSANEKLTHLSCSWNYLTSLDVSNNLMLDRLICYPVINENGIEVPLPILYMAEGQTIKFCAIDPDTVIEYK